MHTIKKIIKVLFNILILAHMYLFVLSSINTVEMINTTGEIAYKNSLLNRFDILSLQAGKVSRSPEETDDFRDAMSFMIEEVRSDAIDLDLYLPDENLIRKVNRLINKP